MLKQIIENYPDVEFLKADGFDSAIIGTDGDVLIYSVGKCLEVLEKTLSPFEAIEYFVFNVDGAYYGEKTPIWCYDKFY